MLRRVEVGNRSFNVFQVAILTIDPAQITGSVLWSSTLSWKTDYYAPQQMIMTCRCLSWGMKDANQYAMSRCRHRRDYRIRHSTLVADASWSHRLTAVAACCRLQGNVGRRMLCLDLQKLPYESRELFVMQQSFGFVRASVWKMKRGDAF